MSNNMKFLLLNITLLAGVYCNCEYSCCADCYKKCCGKGDNENGNENDILANNNNQLHQLNNNDIKNEINKNKNNEVIEDNENAEEKKENDINNVINENNNEGDEPKDNENAEEKKDLYFKIKEGAIYNNKLGCFGNGWFGEYNIKRRNKHNDTILLYELEEQPDVSKKEVGTLVYSQKNKKLEYTEDNDLPYNLKDSDNKWAIFKVTTLKKVNNQEQKGDSYIFYCSDVSTLDSHGLFERVRCYSIEILAANTQRVNTFSSMFWYTVSLLEQDTNQPDASGFIGLEKLDLSSAKKLSEMFYMALFKQETIDSLSTWRLLNSAYISQMFYVNKNSHIYRALYANKNGLSFRALNEWMVGSEGFLRCPYGSEYNVFFQGQDNKKNKDILPDWYENKIQLVEQ
ncbi:MAG: hypothetical protein II393_02705 [Cytophagales bacterium]|nr:hypothetical protein [Cytophagales bacterium]